MPNFMIQQIAEGTYSILDEGVDIFFVLEGSKLAAVSDTGVTRY